MNRKTRFAKRIAIVVGVSLMFLVGVQGCDKEEPAAQQSPQTTSMDTAANTAQDPVEAAEETAQAATSEVVAATEQTTCPVMEGNPINKDLFVEYKGKKVYFCCKGCEQQFQADPEKYVATLPQFQN